MDEEGKFFPVHNSPIHALGQYGKRLFDLIFALAMLILALPLMALAALCIKLEDGGPVIFAQPRIGRGKRVFTMYKFRSMTTDAEKRKLLLERLNEMEGPAFKMRNDPRVTRTGRWLRRHNIDELPQLINVLKGDMSVVGPRPISQDDYLRGLPEWADPRFSVKPGLTCLWQVMPDRNKLRFQEWMELDLIYIDHKSFLVDLNICLHTLPACFGPRHARAPDTRMPFAELLLLAMRRASLGS